MEILMSVAIALEFPLSRLRSAILVATMALPLGCTGAVAASSVHGEEASRIPVEYFATSNCPGSGPSCGASFVTTPGGKKRLQVVGVSCWARNDTGILYLAEITGHDTIGYDYLSPQYTGVALDDKIYTASSEKRYFVEKNEDLTVYFFSSGEPVAIHCTLLGELVTFK
jgi:hypothetical protein